MVVSSGSSYYSSFGKLGALGKLRGLVATETRVEICEKWVTAKKEEVKKEESRRKGAVWSFLDRIWQVHGEVSTEKKLEQQINPEPVE